MSKPMTHEQIEKEIIAIQSECDYPDEGQRAAQFSAIRQAFTLGQDNGKAIILERAAELVAPSVGNAGHEALGRSFSIVMAWINHKSGRSFQGVQRTEFAQEPWSAWVMRADSDKLSADDSWSEFVYGSTMNEAMARLATWCAEHDAANGITSRDTEPAPPESIGGSHYTGDAEPAPITERNS